MKYHLLSFSPRFPPPKKTPKVSFLTHKIYPSLLLISQSDPPQNNMSKRKRKLNQRNP